MNLTNKKVLLKNGTIHTIIKHDNYLHINIDGVEKIYNFEYSFKNGFIQLLDNKLQNKIIKKLNKKTIHQNKISQYKSSLLNKYQNLIYKINKSKYSKKLKSKLRHILNKKIFKYF